MNPRIRQFILAGIGCVVAVWLAAQLASGSFFWPALAGLVAVAGIFVCLLGIEVDVILLGLVIFGYIVGNRGFAQVMPIRGVPLLPAEAVLLVALGWRTVRAAFARELPWRRDALDWTILAWLVVGTARFAFDLPRFGFLAARDYAVVYYALFFFLARHMAADAAARRYLIGCVVAGCLTVTFTYPLSEAFPDFFHGVLVFGDTPLFYYKDDIALTLIVAGSFLVFFRAVGRQRWWAWPAACVMFCGTLVGDVRAAMVAGAIVLGMLALARRWLFPLLQAGLVALALLVLLGVATLTTNTWAERRLDVLAAQAHSIVSLEAPNSSLAPKFYKQDNNRFRLVWWRSVAIDVWEANPAFGLGFGYDLAAGFIERYDQDLGDEFAARSPHSVAFTALGRMGATGLAIWLAFSLGVTIRSWRVLRRSPDPGEVGLWCGVMAILISAHFGVVLEGPMGAVVFWSLLGLAGAEHVAAEAETEIATEEPAPLPNPAASA